MVVALPVFIFRFKRLFVREDTYLGPVRRVGAALENRTAVRRRLVSGAKGSRWSRSDATRHWNCDRRFENRSTSQVYRETGHLLHARVLRFPLLLGANVRPECSSSQVKRYLVERSQIHCVSR